MAKRAGNHIALAPSDCSTWAEVEMMINALAAQTPSLAQKTLENAQILARFSAGRYRTPDEIGVGYFPTIQITWSSTTPPIEIEIFQDHYEFYRFREGATDIQHVAHTSDKFPEALEILLDRIIP